MTAKEMPLEEMILEEVPPEEMTSEKMISEEMSSEAVLPGVGTGPPLRLAVAGGPHRLSRASQWRAVRAARRARPGRRGAL